MEQERISVPALNPFAKEYISGSKQTGGFFDYEPFSQQSFQQRAEEVKKRVFKRDELAQVIRQYMEPYSITPETEHSLEKLKDPSSVVVIGGQQAGLLTGPLYSIHKIISILHVAKEQEEKLGIPVVPVFWIAGEDHDLLEINHVFVEQKGNVQKIGYPERFVKKQAASETIYKKETMESWVQSVFSALRETQHTNQLLSDLQQAIRKSETFTEFFAFLTSAFFAKYGLLLIDAADPALRQLEVPFFKQLITENEALTERLKQSQKKIEEQGFKPAIETGEHPAHLFIIEDGERHLLEKESGLYVSKSGRTYTEAELLQLLESSPESFSNNVVTRPLMQEWLFPTVAFIAGPGEIAYWAELKEAFAHFNMKMPIVVPRVNITIIDRDVAGILQEVNISASRAVQYGVQDERNAYLDSIRDHHLHDLVAEIKRSLFDGYDRIEKQASSIHNGLLPLVEKNKKFHTRQLDVLIQKSDAVLAQTHEAAIARFDRVQSALRPDGLQERVWNIYPFLNEYGPDLIDELMGQSYVHDGSHYLLYM